MLDGLSLIVLKSVLKALFLRRVLLSNSIIISTMIQMQSKLNTKKSEATLDEDIWINSKHIREEFYPAGKCLFFATVPPEER